MVHLGDAVSELSSFLNAQKGEFVVIVGHFEACLGDLGVPLGEHGGLHSHDVVLSYRIAS